MKTVGVKCPQFFVLIAFMAMSVFILSDDYERELARIP